MSWTAGQTYRFSFATQDALGAPADADSLPTGSLYLNGVSSAATVTITDSGVGFYRASVSLAGFSVGDQFEAEVSATIGGVTYKRGMGSERIDVAVDSRLAPAIAGRNLTVSASGQADTDKTGYQLKADQYAAIREEIDNNSTQLAAIVADTNDLQTNQGNWLTATGFSTHSAADVWTTGTRTLSAFGYNVDLNADQSGVTIGTVTVNTDIVTAQAIASATRDAVLDRALAGSHDTAGTPGALLQTVATLLTAAGYTAPPTAAAIADAVWDEAQGDHVAAGSFGLYLDAAISGVSVGGLTAQQVADALKLAPATGDHATGSVYAGLETILGRTAGGIVVSSGFIDGDGVTLLLSQGEAYTTSVSNPIEISIKDARLQPTITTDATTVALKLAPRNGVGDKLEITGTIIAHHSETSTADVRFEMTAVQSAALKAGARAYRWDVEFQIAGNAANVVTSIIDAPCTIAEQVV